jgi:hypothetical protein
MSFKRAEHVAMTEMAKSDGFDLDHFLHPAKAFESPAQVVDDPDLTTAEKRAILASWASDACALEAAPELREPIKGRVVKFDEIMDALRTLDGEATKKPHYPKLFTRAQRLKEAFRPRGSGNTTTP